MMRFGVLLIVVAVAAIGTGCGGSSSVGSAGLTTQRPPRTIRLQPGHYTFQLGRHVQIGDKVVCVTPTHAPAGGGFVEKPGHSVAASTGFILVVSSAGRVKITCPAHPGTM
jgi:hypothetical protein